MIKETHNGYNILWTSGDLSNMIGNRHYTKDLYDAHLWFHNQTKQKNHTTLTNNEVVTFKYKHNPRPTLSPDYISDKKWTTKQMKGHYMLGGVIGFILGAMVTLYVLDYNNLLAM
jgi:hypothetical protein